jgi:hypothetical protein
VVVRTHHVLIVLIDGLAPHLRIHYQFQPPPPRQTANSSSQYHRAYDRAQAPRRINPPRDHTLTAPDRNNSSSRINPPREHKSTTLEGYNSSNLYGKRTSDNQTQLEHQSLGGYAQTQPLPHNPYNPQQIYTPAAPNRQETPQGLGHIAPIGGTIVQAPPKHKQRARQLQAPQTSLNEPTGQLLRPARRTMVRLLHGDTIRRQRHKMGHTLNNTPSRPIPHLLTQRIHSTATTQQPPPRLPAPLPR